MKSKSVTLLYSFHLLCFAFSLGLAKRRSYQIHHLDSLHRTSVVAPHRHGQSLQVLSACAATGICQRTLFSRYHQSIFLCLMASVADRLGSLARGSSARRSLSSSVAADRPANCIWMKRSNVRNQTVLNRLLIIRVQEIMKNSL